MSKVTQLAGWKKPVKTLNYVSPRNVYSIRCQGKDDDGIPFSVYDRVEAPSPFAAIVDASRHFGASYCIKIGDPKNPKNPNGVTDLKIDVLHVGTRD